MKLRYIMSFVLMIILVGCSNNQNVLSPQYISKEKAIEIAKKYEDHHEDLIWETKFEENREFDINNKKEKYTVWIVTGSYPAGNKMIVYINAKNEQIIVISELEANLANEENTSLNQLQQVPNEQFMMDLRVTMNLSLKILHAMERNNYEYLESVFAPSVGVNKEKNEIVYTIYGEEIRLGFLKNIHLGNIEYWGSGYMDNDTTFQIILAHYSGDTHGTIYLDYIKQDNEWLLKGIMTNA